MKPLKLTIEGINSFIEPVSVDFEKLSDSGIFCICGPTGSGKTTVLDSIVLALYAPKSNNRGSLRDYVNTKCEAGRVTLVFEADGETYEVAREFRKKENASSKAKLVRSGEVLADKTEDVNARIAAMLKLERDEFTRVAVLEQGKFAEFMNATPAKRTSIVSKLFSLERFDVLKEKAAKAKNKYDRLLGEQTAALKQYEGVTEAELTAQKRNKKEIEKNIAAIEKTRKAAEERERVALQNKPLFEQKQAATLALGEAESTLKAAHNEKGNLQIRQEAHRKRKEEVAALVAQKEGANAVLHALDECRRDEEEKKKKEEKRQSLADAYKQAERELQALNVEKEGLRVQKEENASKVAGSMRDVTEAGYACDGSAESFAVVVAQAAQDGEALIQCAEKKAAAQEKLKTLQALGEKLLKGEGELSEALEKATEKERAAQAEADRLQKENAAAAVQQLLSDGDVCPVCGGAYHGEHIAADEGALGKAQDRLRAVKSEVERIKDELQKIRSDQSVCGANTATEKKALAEAEEREKALPRGAAAAKVAATAGMTAAKAKADAEQRAETNALKIAQAQKAIEDAKREGCAVRAEIDGLQARIEKRLNGKNFEDAEREAKKTLLACEQAEEEERAEAEKIQKDEQALLMRIAAATEKKENAARTCAALKDVTFDAAEATAAMQEKQAASERLTAAHAALGGAESSIADLETRLAKKKELQKAKSETEKIAEDVAALYKCVERENPLLGYVAESYVQAFTAAASETLSFLTDGKYTLFYDDGDFYVADFFCDNARRKVKTLSGGETFLASVSIAMAVSREIAEKDFGFFFLDEGFGTLGEKALATVTQALYKLSRDTTVGVVTHRSELAERIPTRLNVVPATEEKGSQIVFASE